MRFPTFTFRVATLAASSLLAAGCAGTHSLGTGPGADLLVYIGTNTGTEAQSSSIYLYRLSTYTGALIPLSSQPGGAQPTYLTVDAAHKYLYAVSETGTFRNQANTGGVSAFAINQQSGALTLLDQQPSAGGGPCYISLDRAGKNALVANYGGGTVAVLPVQADGQLAPPSATDAHQPPLGPHKNQDHAHAHCFIADPTGRYAFAVDLGTDKVYGYRLDAAGQLAPQASPAFTAKPGAGPRHLVFHPGGRFAYLENELNSTVTALSYDAGSGTFTELETQSTLPRGFVGDNSGADVHVSPDGRFLYTSNRGDNSLAVFSIDTGTGRLVLVEHTSTQGKTPRNFTLTPDGRLLLVANQNSGNVFSYFVDKRTGRLRPTGQSAQVPTPMFVQVLPDFVGAK